MLRPHTPPPLSRLPQLHARCAWPGVLGYCTQPQKRTLFRMLPSLPSSRFQRPDSPWQGCALANLTRSRAYKQNTAAEVHTRLETVLVEQLFQLGPSCKKPIIRLRQEQRRARKRERVRAMLSSTTTDHWVREYTARYLSQINNRIKGSE